MADGSLCCENIDDWLKSCIIEGITDIKTRQHKRADYELIFKHVMTCYPSTVSYDYVVLCINAMAKANVLYCKSTKRGIGFHISTTNEASPSPNVTPLPVPCVDNAKDLISGIEEKYIAKFAVLKDFPDARSFRA